MKTPAANYKKDIKRFNELAQMLKAPQKVKRKDPDTYKAYEDEHDELKEKLEDYDYDAEYKMKKKMKKLEKEEAKEKAKKFEKKQKEDLINATDEYLETFNLKRPDIDDDDQIKKAERLFESDLKEVKEETTITTKADGTEIVEVKKKLVKPEIYMQEPRYTKNQLRHKKFYEGKESREDLSEEVKAILDKRVKSAGLPPAKFVGKAGGKRKILCCPHCDGEMIATGVKATTADNTRQKTPAMKAWHDLIKAVGEMPEHKGKKRPELMPIASALKEKHGGSVNAISAMFQGEV
jgi:hypothetical protein